jgi:hypothetical protein
MIDSNVAERNDFSGRLALALIHGEFDPRSPTQLAREFNARFSGRPITVHAARKWLVGDAIPTQEKLRVLAHWLGVTPEWLRFGSGEQGSGTSTPAPIDSAGIRLASDFQRLDPKSQKLAREFVRLLLREMA